MNPLDNMGRQRQKSGSGVELGRNPRHGSRLLPTGAPSQSLSPHILSWNAGARSYDLCVRGRSSLTAGSEGGRQDSPTESSPTASTRLRETPVSDIFLLYCPGTQWRSLSGPWLLPGDTRFQCSTAQQLFRWHIRSLLAAPCTKRRHRDAGEQTHVLPRSLQPEQATCSMHIAFGVRHSPLPQSMHYSQSGSVAVPRHTLSSDKRLPMASVAETPSAIRQSLSPDTPRSLIGGRRCVPCIINNLPSRGLH